MDLKKFEIITKTEQDDFYNRRGKILIPQEILDHNPLLTMIVQSKILITRAEFLYSMRSLEIHGYSKDFEKVDIGTIDPFYDVDIKKINDFNYKIKFIKK
jgi:hypothetical protein